MELRELEEYYRLTGFKGSSTVSIETLRELHLKHTLRFPFENIDPFLGDEVSLEAPNLMEKFFRRNRGGYCFEQNTLFKSVLERIGFKTRRLGARVLWNQSEELITRRSHMLTLVEVQEKKLLVDVGFGGLTLTSPLEFIPNIEQPTTHELFRIMSYKEDYILQAQVSDTWKTLYRFDLQEQYRVDYEIANFYLYTHPASIFRNTLIAAKPTGEGRMALSNNQFTIYSKDGRAEKSILRTVDEIKRTLEEKFGIKIEREQVFDERINSLIGQ